MKTLIFNHNHELLPSRSLSTIPVQIYNNTGKIRNDLSFIGNPVLDKIKRLGVPLSDAVMDFLSISLAVTAADTFVKRETTADSWTRQLNITLPLCNPMLWYSLKKELESALHFLSGDIWSFEFLERGVAPPIPYEVKSRRELVNLQELDCVSLFSGGLDSAIGAIDLLSQERKPLLVSHAYKGDKSHQDGIALALNGRFSRLAVNAHPISANHQTEITMRTRSLNFLAFGAIGASAIQQINQKDKIDLFVPENGFISLNPPLTNRRIGSLSTRTTHPHFIELIQRIFNAAAIPCTIQNQYQFKTKGEMATECLDQSLLSNIVDHTVSCSHWKRKHKQCGVCVPCTIRRASLYASNIPETESYIFNNIASALNHENKKDDLHALSIAANTINEGNVLKWVLNSGRLENSKLDNYKALALRGLHEVKDYLIQRCVL